VFVWLNELITGLYDNSLIPEPKFPIELQELIRERLRSSFLHSFY